MRDVVRIARSFAFSIALAVGISAVLTAGHAAERRLIVTPEADYSGFDYDTLKDVDRSSCAAACLADQSCQAFTFNLNAGWCFKKSDFGQLSAATGSFAGRVVTTPELTPSLKQRRLGELDFIDQSFIDEALVLADELKRRFDPGTTGFDSLLRDSHTTFRVGSFDVAARLAGRTLLHADDRAETWLAFAAASERREPKRQSGKQAAWRDLTAGAINGYLRADADDERARALNLIGTGLGKRAEWALAIRAYRKSLALKDNRHVRALYDEALALHGLRILSHAVDSDTAQPRICIVFSDELPVTRPGLADFVVVSGGNGLAIEPEKNQICVDGVSHGSRYQIRVRAGLPAANGLTLMKAAELNVYVRDRAPWLGFAGNAYVLPAGSGASIPLDSVNAEIAKAAIYRISDRSLAGEIREGTILRQLNRYSADEITDKTGENVWEGEIDITTRLNETVTTAVPISQAVTDLQPGAYAITASLPTSGNRWDPVATQWFVISDLGLTALSGTDGVHVIVRSLASAGPVADIAVRLVATNNNILGEAVTDANGYARFEPGLARGKGGMEPRIIDATSNDDFAFLDIGLAAFDLTDRGVEGRAAPGPLDVFMTSERGIYRPGETVYLTALVRDAKANAVAGLPMTLVVDRPDGVELDRWTVMDGGAGGYSSSILLDDNAMRGAWRARLYADPKGNALADLAVLVEDFEPERIAFEIETAAAILSKDTPTTMELSARYLYGADAPGLRVTGDVAIRPVSSNKDFPGFVFGLTDDSLEAQRFPIDAIADTDQAGAATLAFDLPELPATTRPLEAEIILRLTDTNGRAVERRLSRPIEAAGPTIGIKPLFEGGDVAEGGPAGFEAIVVAPDGTRIAADGLEWTLDRIETNYQWYRQRGNWRYEPITTSRRVVAGSISTGIDDATRIEAPVDWGRYRLTITSAGTSAGAPPAASSFDFAAGWYVATTSVDTPDVLAVALDKPTYAIGETAKLRLDPRFAGIALISIIDNRVIAMKAVEVPEEGSVVELEVTEAWGPGAYIAASLYRPMDIAAKRMPARAMGIAWAEVSPGDRKLSVSLDVAEELRPRGAMTVPISIDNLQPGAKAFVTVAAVNVGILNLTQFKAPAPDEWYFGQRRLGMEIRDLYGHLIDRTQGEPGTIRSGGDGVPFRLDAPPPTQELLAFYSGIVAVDDAGKASVSFDLPAFNGTVRLMAMAWSDNAVGHATKDVIVRDPVVVAASLPRFLATGDTSRIMVEIDNVSGAAGNYRLSIDSDEGVDISPEYSGRIITLGESQKTSLLVPIAGDIPGDHIIRVTLNPPSGEALSTALTLGVRPPGREVTRRNVVALNSGGRLMVGADTIEEFVPGTASVTVSASGAGRLDVAGILQELDRYPYGCSEQLTSRALPLLYLDEVAASIGLGDDKEIRERVQQAIFGVLANQNSGGGFGLWGAYFGNDLWLDAYITDFLTRAKERGFDVPKTASEIAIDNLANRLSYVPDFTSGGEDIAYALYVLTRAGKASIGDLRYYADVKLDAFSTPLAKAQIGAALALYGDRQRTDKAFTAALSRFNAAPETSYLWRADYGSKLRDGAAILTLAAESRTEAIDISALASQIAALAETKNVTSTQEQSWMMLAAAALIDDASEREIAIDGELIANSLFRQFDGAGLASAPVIVKNLGTGTLEAVVAVTGVPIVPEPAGGNGFAIERDYFTPHGEPVDIATVGQNDRFIVVLTVTGKRAKAGRLLVVDPIPAGFEIENPSLSASGQTNQYDWLSLDNSATHTEARTDRFVASFDRKKSDEQMFKTAYAVRAVSPGNFAQPGASVEDMYTPELFARTGAGRIEIVGPTR